MKNLVLLLAVLLLLISCENESVTPNNPIANLMNLKVGNYWVYDWYEIDATNGNATNLNKRDSLIIVKDTIISGRTYFIKRGNFFGNSQQIKTLLFDSINSIFSFPDKEIVLTLNRSLVIIRDFGSKANPIAIGYYSLDDKNVSIQVPAGNFQSINFRGRIEPQYASYPYGIRYNDNFYADNVGLIKVRTQLYSSPNDIEMRLVKHGSVN
jgi:hypothetical protein